MNAETTVSGFNPAGRTDRRRSTAIRAALCLALLGIVVWYVLVTLRRPTLMGDEHYHVPAIRALADGDWEAARALPMLPTYHIIAVLPLHVLGRELWVLRALNAVLACLAIILYHTAARVRHANYGPQDLLRLAWNPLLLPYWVLIYTDVASLLMLLAALNFHVRSRHALAAGGLLLACLIRQDNAVWVIFFATLAAVELWQTRPEPRPGYRVLPRFLRRRALPVLWPYLPVSVAAAALLVVNTGPTYLPNLMKEPRFNPAQFYVLALTAGLLWAPFWVEHLVRAWPRRFGPALMRPGRCAAVVAVVGLLALAFRNPHPWNLDLSFLRNWPLYALTLWPFTRFLAAAVIVVCGVTLLSATWSSPARRTLGLIWLFALLFVLPHYLVDPRYYIFPFVLVDFFTPYSPAQARRLTAWYLLLSVGVALFIVGRSGGGVW